MFLLTILNWIDFTRVYYYNNRIIKVPIFLIISWVLKFDLLGSISVSLLVFAKGLLEDVNCRLSVDFSNLVVLPSATTFDANFGTDIDLVNNASLIILLLDRGVSSFKCFIKLLDSFSHWLQAIHDVCFVSFKFFLFFIIVEVLNIFFTVSWLPIVRIINFVVSNTSLLHHHVCKSSGVVVLFLHNAFSSFSWSESDIISGLWE